MWEKLTAFSPRLAARRGGARTHGFPGARASGRPIWPPHTALTVEAALDRGRLCLGEHLGAPVSGSLRLEVSRAARHFHGPASLPLLARAASECHATSQSPPRTSSGWPDRRLS